MERPRRSLKQALREAGQPNRPGSEAARPPLPPGRHHSPVDREGQDAEPGAIEAGVTPPLAPRGRPAAPPDLRAMLRSRAALRQAFLLREILGPPRALHDPKSDGR
jgi:hypothetical protein